MRTINRSWIRTVALASAVSLAVACEGDFLDVPDPTVIDAETIDPVLDLPTFARSALQNLFDAFDNVVVYSAWFSGEAYVGDTFPTRNDIGRRVVEYSNGTLRDELYFPLARAISTNETVLEVLRESGVSNAEAASTANFASAYAIVLMAENFCEVVISRGYADADLGAPVPATAAMDSAIARFDAAIVAATADGNDDIVDAANVGKARAYLFLERYPRTSSTWFPRSTTRRSAAASATPCGASRSSVRRSSCRPTTGR